MRQLAGGGTSDVADAEGVEQPVVAFCTAFVKCPNQVLCRLAPHSFQIFELWLLQKIEVTNILHQFDNNKLIHQRFAKTLYIHGIA